MAKTELFRALQSLIRATLNAEQHDKNPNLRLEGQKISRRQVLQATSVLVPSLLMGAGLAKPIKTKEKIAIVGGGTAGLVAAYRLKQRGVFADIYEASSRVGGRMFSGYNVFGGGETLEWGGELVDSGHLRLQGLVKELGLNLTDLAEFERKNALEPELWHFGGQRYRQAEMVAALRPLLPALKNAVDSLEETVTYQNPSEAARFLDAFSISSWLDQVEAQDPIKAMLKLAYTTEYGLEPEEQSVLNLFALIGLEQKKFQIYGESDERYHIKEGSGAVPVKLGRNLNSQIQTGMALEAISQRSSGRFVLHFSSGKQLEADHVILALPFTLLRQVEMDLELPQAKRLAINTLGYGTNAKLFVGYNRPVWRELGSSGSTFSDLGYQTTWDTTRGQKSAKGVMVNFVGGKHGLEVGKNKPTDQAKTFVDALERVYPSSKAQYSGQAERFFWPSKPWVQGSYQCYLPGQYTSIRGAEGEKVGRLYFCGEHTSIEAAGYMEGAVETGERVALEVLAALK